MPRRYRNRRRRKRPYKKRYTSITKYSGRGLSDSTPLGKKFLWKTRYVETNVSLNGGVGGLPVSYVYSLTGLFDPNVTGVGHQPLGFDQLMAMYDHYTVIGARARVTLSNSENTTPQMAMLQIKDTDATSVDVQSIIENGYSRWTTLAARGSGGDTKTLSINFNTKKFFGKSSMDDRYSGNVAGNPLDQAYLHLTIKPVGTSDLNAVVGTVEIQYIAVLTEPRQLASS